MQGGPLAEFFSYVTKTNLEKQTEVDKRYQYWRLRIFYSMFIGYAFFYFTRKSYNFVMPVLMNDLGYSKAELGIFGTALYLSYGISKFVSGIISEYANPRYLMAVGLIITGFMNIFFGFCSALWAFTIICILNGWFQGWGWPPCTKLLTYWYSRSERGTWWSLCSTSHGVGGMLIPLYAGYIAVNFSWQCGMYLSGTIGIVAGLFLINRLRNIPQTLGLPPIEEHRNDYPSSKEILESKLRKKLTIRQILFEQILKNRWVWLLAISYLFVYAVRTGVNDWAHIFLNEYKGYGIILSNAGIFWFEIGGIIGMLVAGFSSDTIFKGNRMPIILGYSIGLLIAIPVFWFLPKNFIFCDYLLLTIIGFLVFGPQMLVGLAVSECVDKEAACTANGFAGLFGCIGSAFASYPIGYIVDHWHWSGYFIYLTCCTLAVLVFVIKVGPLIMDKKVYN